MNEEIRIMTRKLNQLEVGMVRVQSALAGFAQVLQHFSGGRVDCAQCSKDITSMTTCAVEECPCGFPATLPEPASDDPVAQD